ncbi:methylase involved in ubiquinone/menaquinone biosynthesis [Desulfosporosinus orientis DSM 765]|uniref:Methylase involved in ubiquinone/menaquinone biosynthesis n=1 Tax=Desulfosporosinus orientis (strain ATCC 19365 / DSM 765 / NCIMB 8382 / VKM B-1628 / Singapore I) TaxID=768706 RepID=G7WFI5_DESOD|nr:methyltransferase domain-containing protein [Desulfosporosinus orientis]AET68428.1 methylase involved in ubiquinone/menaquinone biosynthesis [Desulfosporosinus orientis DSM 765]
METESVIEKIGAYWDERSSVFDKEHDTEDLNAWSCSLEKLLGPDKSKSVLDLGTGTGFLANLTARLGYPSLGIDISQEMMSYALRHAKTVGSNAVYMKGSVLDLPFMDNTADYIINARLIWTIVEPDISIQEWFRVVKPGGKIFCFNRMKEGVGLTSKKESIYENEEVDKHLLVKTARMDELMDLLTRNGFVDVQIEKLPGLTRPGYDYEPWFVLMGTKPVFPRQIEEDGMAAFWDKSTGDYEETHEVADKETWQEVLRELIGHSQGLKILDVGTGTGILANILGSMGYQDVLGVDLSEGMMRIAMEHAKEQDNKVRYKYANALDLPFAGQSFDVVISSRLLWTLTEPAAALQEWRRVLKNGGRLIAINELEPGTGIRCENIEDYRQNINARALPWGNGDNEEILGMFKACGWNQVEIKHLPGCHLLNSQRENWYAFTGRK